MQVNLRQNLQFFAAWWKIFGVIRTKNGKQGGSVSFRSSRCRVMQADANRTEDNSSSSSPAVIGTETPPPLLDAMQPPPPGISLPAPFFSAFLRQKERRLQTGGYKKGNVQQSTRKQRSICKCYVLYRQYHTYSRSFFYTGGFHRSKKVEFFLPHQKRL